MAAVFLSILKITGIILLCIICLILLIAALILFVPIRYRINAQKPLGDYLTASVGVSYLLYILSGKVLLHDFDTDISFRVFGIKVYPRKKKEETDTKPDEAALKDSKEPAPENGKVSGDQPESPAGDIPSEDDFLIDWNEETSEETHESFEEDDELVDDGLAEKIEQIIEKIASKYDSVSEKYEKIRFKIRFWDKMRCDERNREAVIYIKEKTLKLLKKIAPRSVKGSVHFGFEDPAVTGWILVRLAIIYPVLPKKLKIDPGFTDTDIYGDLKIKGRICLITPAVWFLGIYFNKDVRRLRRLYKKYKERS